MGLEEDIAFFEQVPSLAALGKQALRVLAIGAETRQLQTGAVLFQAGDAADGGYIVQEGSLLVEPTHGEKYTVKRGAMVGEMALLMGTVMQTTITAQEPTTLVRISRSLFRKMLEGYPAAATRLRENLVERLGAWTRDLEDVKSRMEREEK